MRYIQLMQTTHFVVFQLANFFLFFFSGKYLIGHVICALVVVLSQPDDSHRFPCTVGHKNHDPCFHKKYKEAAVMIFVAHRTFTS